jgi:7-carboxy-7-deazaguanine synthase
MQITEIFRSIQGESTHAGLLCIFVRLTGCNLRCVWCDTAYAFHGGTKMSVEEILARVNELAGAVAQPLLAAQDGGKENRAGPSAPLPSPLLRASGTSKSACATTIRLVELTGGEPLLQPEIVPLSEKLLGAGYTVLIETSGERFVGNLPKEVIKIVDVKCPDSGEGGTFDMNNLAAVDAKDEIKFVIASRRDYEFAREFTREHDLAARVRQVIFSPVFADPEGKWPALEARALAEWMLADRLPVRLGLQLHKFIWDPAMKGV